MADERMMSPMRVCGFSFAPIVLYGPHLIIEQAIEERGIGK
jgi:hypothetical protein